LLRGNGPAQQPPSRGGCYPAVAPGTASSNRPPEAGAALRSRGIRHPPARIAGTAPPPGRSRSRLLDGSGGCCPGSRTPRPRGGCCCGSRAAPASGGQLLPSSCLAGGRLLPIICKFPSTLSARCRLRRTTRRERAASAFFKTAAPRALALCAGTPLLKRSVARDTRSSQHVGHAARRNRTRNAAGTFSGHCPSAVGGSANRSVVGRVSSTTSGSSKTPRSHWLLDEPLV
jgi:hypothetical protein